MDTFDPGQGHASDKMEDMKPSIAARCTLTELETQKVYFLLHLLFVIRVLILSTPPQKMSTEELSLYLLFKAKAKSIDFSAYMQKRLSYDIFW
jgi:hypothetical protein